MSRNKSIVAASRLLVESAMQVCSIRIMVSAEVRFKGMGGCRLQRSFGSFLKKAVGTLSTSAEGARGSTFVYIV